MAKPQETLQQQMARQRREADAPFRRRIGVCVIVAVVLVCFALAMAGF